MPDYQKKTVAELTEILKSRSLPHTGKKADLVARLNEADKKAESATAQPATTTTTEVAAKAGPVAAPLQVSTPALDGVAGAPKTETKLEQPDTESTQKAREGTATTDANLASAVDYSMGLNTSTVDDEMKKRKARAERFGTATTQTDPNSTSNPDAEAAKALERAKRFGTETTSEGTGIGKLDEALPMERERKRKGQGNFDDPGLKQQRTRGGFRGRGGRSNSRPRGDKPDGVRKVTSGGLSEKDKLAAEARKKRFTENS